MADAKKLDHARNKQTFSKSAESRAVIRTALNSNFIFSSMVPSEIDALLEFFENVTCKRGESIIIQGEEGDYFCA